LHFKAVIEFAHPTGRALLDAVRDAAIDAGCTRL